MFKMFTITTKCFTDVEFSSSSYKAFWVGCTTWSKTYTAFLLVHIVFRWSEDRLLWHNALSIQPNFSTTANITLLLGATLVCKLFSISYWHLLCDHFRMIENNVLPKTLSAVFNCSVILIGQLMTIKSDITNAYDISNSTGPETLALFLLADTDTYM